MMTLEVQSIRGDVQYFRFLAPFLITLYNSSKSHEIYRSFDGTSAPRSAYVRN
jgi:hypothetical protein